MKGKWRARAGNRRGQVVIMTAFLAVGLLGMAGVVLDLGRLYIVKAELSKAVDGGSLAGARVLPSGQIAAEQAALNFAGMNFKRSMGQSCMSQSRIFVHSSRRDEFVEAFTSLVAGLRVGDPTQADTDIGPLAFDAHRNRVLGHIETAHIRHA